MSAPALDEVDTLWADLKALVTAREAQASARRAELDRREAELRAREERLNSRIPAFDARQAALNEREGELLSLENSLKEREAALNEAEESERQRVKRFNRRWKELLDALGQLERLKEELQTGIKAAESTAIHTNIPSNAEFTDTLSQLPSATPPPPPPPTYPQAMVTIQGHTYPAFIAHIPTTTGDHHHFVGPPPPSGGLHPPPSHYRDYEGGGGGWQRRKASREFFHGGRGRDGPGSRRSSSSYNTSFGKRRYRDGGVQGSEGSGRRLQEEMSYNGDCRNTLKGGTRTEDRDRGIGARMYSKEEERRHSPSKHARTGLQPPEKKDGRSEGAGGAVRKLT